MKSILNVSFKPENNIYYIATQAQTCLWGGMNHSTTAVRLETSFVIGKTSPEVHPEVKSWTAFLYHGTRTCQIERQGPTDQHDIVFDACYYWSSSLSHRQLRSLKIYYVYIQACRRHRIDLSRWRFTCRIWPALNIRQGFKTLCRCAGTISDNGRRGHSPLLVIIQVNTHYRKATCSTNKNKCSAVLCTVHYYEQ